MPQECVAVSVHVLEAIFQSLREVLGHRDLPCDHLVPTPVGFLIFFPVQHHCWHRSLMLGYRPNEFKQIMLLSNPNRRVHWSSIPVATDVFGLSIAYRSPSLASQSSSFSSARMPSRSRYTLALQSLLNVFMCLLCSLVMDSL